MAKKVQGILYCKILCHRFDTMHGHTVCVSVGNLIDDFSGTSLTHEPSTYMNID